MAKKDQILITGLVFLGLVTSSMVFAFQPTWRIWYCFSNELNHRDAKNCTPKEVAASNAAIATDDAILINSLIDIGVNRLVVEKAVIQAQEILSKRALSKQGSR